jgi:hypothetical protein
VLGDESRLLPLLVLFYDKSLWRDRPPWFVRLSIIAARFRFDEVARPAF